MVALTQVKPRLYTLGLEIRHRAHTLIKLQLLFRYPERMANKPLRLALIK